MISMFLVSELGFIDLSAVALWLAQSGMPVWHIIFV
jgi:hypothetical protein